MSLQRIASRVKPARVTRTIVLYDSRLPALARPFGRGILRSLPTYYADHTAADAAWAAQAFATAEPDYDAMAGAAAYLDAHESGLKTF